MDPRVLPVTDYPVKPVPFTSVRCDDLFWAPRIETNRTVTIPFGFEKCEETGRVDLFHRAAASLRGDKHTDKTPPGLPFDDTDVYKLIEGAAYTLSVHPDPALESYIDSLVRAIASAQEPDGYLYTARTINPENPHAWAGASRWELERERSHELYNLGHLYEAAVAYEQATGKRDLLDVAIRTAEMLVRTFGADKQAIWPGHQIIELGLVKLYRTTGESRYLELARFFLDSRGPDGFPGSSAEYNQSHMPVVDQREAVGHAVRAAYMYAGMADVAALTGNSSYIKALDRIWQDVVSTKLYITGGIGSTAEGEAFGPGYDLPNLTAYCETCAAIANALWNQRLFLLHADASYIDVLERTLYNGLLSGVSLDGASFFYPNPLESDGTHERSPWFGCACCPSNVARFLPSLPGYVYAQQGDVIYVNLFVSSTAEIALDDGQAVTLRQETGYPWNGQVRLTVEPGAHSPFTIKVRIPGWARNEPVPSNLYRFVDQTEEVPTLEVNGRIIALKPRGGYISLRRQWEPGDVIELYFPMPVRRIAANDRVEADRGKVALQRGPLVYCVEWPDNPNLGVRDMVLPESLPLAAELGAGLLGGIVVLHGQAMRQVQSETGMREATMQDFTAIPYYTWANRGPGEMVVWLPGVLHEGA